MYLVAYLIKARRTYLDGTFSLDHAIAHVKRLKRRGMDSWVEETDGTFVPIVGVKRRPSFIE